MGVFFVISHGMIVLYMKHYFFPTRHNSYHPHIFSTKKIMVIMCVALAIFATSIFGSRFISTSGILASIQTAFLVELTNQDRQNNSAQSLQVNPLLVEAAQRKANDMASKSYFAHTSPEGLTPWFWFGDVGYSYKYAGENLAVNFSDSLDVHRAWLASPTHKKNIIDPRFTEIGIATAQGVYKGRPATFVVQMFGTPRFEVPENTLSQKLQNVDVLVSEIPENDIFGFEFLPQEVLGDGDVAGNLDQFVEESSVVADSKDIQDFYYPTQDQLSFSNITLFEKIIISPISFSFLFLLVLIIILIIVLTIQIGRAHV
jgi:hypothetical protein